MVNLEKFRVGAIAVVLFAMLLCVGYYMHTANTILKITATTSQRVLPEECADLGIEKDFNVSSKHRQLHQIHAHTFQFPSPMDNAYLCVPSKNGNKNWGALFYRLWGMGIPDNGQIVTDSVHHYQRQTFPGSDVRMWMVSRSPYVRILSTYIEKVECVGACDHQYLEGFHHFKEFGNITFESFVQILHGLVVRGRDTSRLKPIQRAAELCHIDHHFCTQSACLFKLPDNSVRVLKLENQCSWFKNFTSCIGISPATIIGEEWTKFSGRPCYYTPTNSCDDALKEQSGSSLLVDPIHGKGAVNKLAQYYTPAAAQLVSYLYEYDLSMLDYPVWDGNSVF